MNHHAILAGALNAALVLSATIGAGAAQPAARILEKEQGGSGLRYSFDMKYHGQAWEVGVDAKTGKILEKAVEGAKPD